MRKMIKNSLCAVLCGAMLLLGASAAQVAATYDRESGKIVITDTASESGYGTFIYILKGRLGENKVSQYISADTLVYAGKCVSEFSIESDGVYTVVFGSKSLPDEADRIVYVLKTDSQTESDGVKAVFAAANESEMLEKLTENNDVSYIVDLNGADTAVPFMFELVRARGLNTKENPTSADLSEVYTFSKELYGLSQAGEKELAEGLLKYKDVFGLNEDIETYAEDTAKRIITSVNGGVRFDTYSSMTKLARESLALSALSNVGADKLYATVDKYNNIFGVTYSARKSDVTEYEVYKYLPTDGFTDVSSVAGIINSAIERAYENKSKQQEDSDTSHRGGNSGGGGGGGYSAPSTVDRDEISRDIGTDTSFADTGSVAWAKDAIDYVSANNIMTGDGSGYFRPSDMLTREELVKIIVCSLGQGKIEKAETDFTDVAENAWYKPYIETAYALGIITGRDNGTFGVGEAVTRQDACVMIARAAEAYYRQFNKMLTLVDIADFDDVSDYAKVGVDTLARAGIINGFDDGTFRPHSNITRAQAAKIMYECMTNIQK